MLNNYYICGMCIFWFRAVCEPQVANYCVLKALMSIMQCLKTQLSFPGHIEWFKSYNVLKHKMLSFSIISNDRLKKVNFSLHEKPC